MSALGQFKAPCDGFRMARQNCEYRLDFLKKGEPVMFKQVWNATTKFVAIAMTAGCVWSGGQASAQTIDAQNPVNFEQLDVNIYWYGPGNVSERAVGGQSNPWFNPSRPTVIYIHGWQPNTTQQRKRESFDRTQYNANADVARGWIDRGWNVGIFYWNQLADESEVKDAEAKIYTVDRSKFTNATRWRDVTGTYRPGPDETVTQQFVRAFKSAMQNYSGSEVRIVGHSLGAQIAVTGTSALWKESKAGTLARNKLPNRVALLDHAYLSGAHAWINDQWTGEVGRALVRENRPEIAYENYRTSGSTSNGFIGDVNNGLMDITAFVEVKPWMYSAFDFAAKHNFAPGYYFEGMNNTSAKVKCTGRPVPSASLALSAVKAFSDAGSKFEQIDGKYSRTPSDDTWDQKGDGC
jgi:Lipase (class 3)